MSTQLRRTGWPVLAAVLLTGCAAPPLRLYTLGDPPPTEDAKPLPRGAPVIEVDRLVLPDALDSDDLLLTDGNVVVRSRTGRWVSRLSLLATGLVTSQLARRAPDALVTDQWPIKAPDYRVMIGIDRLDIARKGWAVMDANWQIFARDRGPESQSPRGHVQIKLTGATATDRDIVRLETALFDRLADRIRLPTS